MSASREVISAATTELAQLSAEQNWSSESFSGLESVISCAQIKHRPKLKRWLVELCSTSEKKSQFLSLLSDSLAISKQRADQTLTFSYDPELPITRALPEIRESLQQSQVVIVAGETGSGKTTQLPKLCLELGRGLLGQIGHTQPRRLAARTVATRIAEELNTSMGSTVGYQFRFDDQSKAETRCKVMTDGILLSEVRRDKLLLNYDTLIIDEAHERSLNIDFLLGYIKAILPKRPDLKLIITSATIDVQRFADYFNGAPVVSVEGRSYPVDIVYQPDNEQAGGALSYAEEIQQTLEAIEEGESSSVKARDVLVFLPGEREIRDVSKQIRHTQSNQWANFEVLPLYARLTRAEQQRVFDEHRRSAKRRVVLATNVAETSVTVPGIGYVIDTGVARVNRYSPQSKLQRLLIEPVSQASARQRAGRCGRIAPGTCYRLYTEQDFEQRPPFTEPEILRTKLASVILQMKFLGLGDIERFPFIEKPDNRQVNRGLKNLVELGAIDHGYQLTKLGRQLAMLPLDPAHGRMLLEARSRGCLEAMLVIVSALAIQDPREMPADSREAADQKHRRFWHPQSDFLMWLNLWLYYQDQAEHLSQTALRKLCKREWLSYTRMREWKDLHWQLRQALNRIFGNRKAEPLLFPLFNEEKLVELNDKQREQAMQANGSWNRRYAQSSYEAIHKSILSGYLLQVGSRMDGDAGTKPNAGGQANSGRQQKRQAFEYRGCSSARFFIFPGSSQFKKPPKWLVVSEITQTQKVYARCVAAIEPDWIEQLAEPMLKYQYAEPRWDQKRGQVKAKRSSSLFGLPIIRNRSVLYEKTDPIACRDCFIREALIAQRLSPDRKLDAVATFWKHNVELMAELTGLEERLRDAALLPDDQYLYQHYHNALPSAVVSRAALYQLLRSNAALNERLCLKRENLVDELRVAQVEQQFPGELTLSGHTFKLTYCFSPGDSQDGVTAAIPLNILHSLPSYGFDWTVPGLLLDKITEMLRQLPKAQRKKLVPLPAAAEKLLGKLDVNRNRNANIPLAQALAEQISIYYETKVDVLSWQKDCSEKLDPIYSIHVNVVDEGESSMALGDNVHDLQRELHEQVEAVIQQVETPAQEKKTYTRWEFGTLSIDKGVSVDKAGVQGYQAIVDEGDHVTTRLFVTEGEANIASREGVLRLAMLAFKDKTRYLKKQLKRMSVPVLPYVSIGQHAELVDDIIKAAIAHCCFADFDKALPTSAEAFERCLQHGGSNVIAIATEIEALVHEILANYQQCCALIQNRRGTFPVLCDDAETQLADLLYPGFLRRVGYSQAKHFPRYLLALKTRLDRIGGNQKTDNEYREKLSSLRERWQSLLYKYPYAIDFDTEVKQYRWMLEELRVSLFAQQLKTIRPVSWQRVDKAWEKVDKTKYPLTH